MTMLNAPSDGMWSLPFFIDGDGYFTALAMANPGGEGVIVGIAAFGADGTVVRRASHWLEARQCRSGLLSEWLTGLSAAGSGHLLVTAAAPVSILFYLGTDDGASLSIIAPLPTVKD
jgi:hypothetical protein